MMKFGQIARIALQSQWRLKKDLRSKSTTKAAEEVDFGNHKPIRSVAVVSLREKAGVRPAADDGREPSIRKGGPDLGVGGRNRSGPCAQAGMTARFGDARERE